MTSTCGALVATQACRASADVSYVKSSRISAAPLAGRQEMINNADPRNCMNGNFIIGQQELKICGPQKQALTHFILRTKCRQAGEPASCRFVVSHHSNIQKPTGCRRSGLDRIERKGILSVMLRLFTRWLWVVCLALPAHGFGAESKQAAQQCFQAGRIRVFYFLEGPHAVDPADANGNSVPDQVEDAITQTAAAQMLFVDVLGFTDPFESPHFRAARFLDIHFRSKETLRNNGVAYDELQRFRRPSDPPGTVSLCFNLATSVKPGANLTPAHEYFHLVQYAATRFKARWFTEGTARWSEYALKEGSLGPVRAEAEWPPGEDKQAALFGMTYEASEHFWNALAAKTDAAGSFPDSSRLADLRAMRYADGKTKVLKDNRLTGWQFMRELLRELDAADDLALKSLGYSEWSEQNQCAPANNRYLLEAVGRALQARAAKEPL